MLDLPSPLSPYVTEIEASLRPCIVLRHGEGPASPLGTRLGGRPWAPPGTPWPRSPARAMSFLGQLDFSELAAVCEAPLPHVPTSGRLLAFYDTEEQAWGYDPEHRPWSRFLFFPDGVELTPMEPADEIQLSPEIRLDPCLRLSLPSPSMADYPFLEDLELSAAFAGFFADYTAEIHGDGWVHHQVGGHPNWVQSDARAEAELVTHGINCGSPEGYQSSEAQALISNAGLWHLLWQISSDDDAGFTWGDLGLLYYLVRESPEGIDPEAGHLILQCG